MDRTRFTVHRTSEIDRNGNLRMPVLLLITEKPQGELLIPIERTPISRKTVGFIPSVPKLPETPTVGGMQMPAQSG
jgi:hypothetical protein